MNLRFFSILLFSSISCFLRFRSSRWFYDTSSSYLRLLKISFSFSLSLLIMLFFFSYCSSLCFCRIFWILSIFSALSSYLSSSSTFCFYLINFKRLEICLEWSTYWDNDLITSCIYYSLFRNYTYSCFSQKSFLFAIFWARIR